MPVKRGRDDDAVDQNVQKDDQQERKPAGARNQVEVKQEFDEKQDLEEIKEMLREKLVENARLEVERSKLERGALRDDIGEFIAREIETHPSQTTDHSEYGNLKGHLKDSDGWTTVANPHAWDPLSHRAHDLNENSSEHWCTVGLKMTGYRNILQAMRHPTSFAAEMGTDFTVVYLGIIPLEEALREIGDGSVLLVAVYDSEEGFDFSRKWAQADFYCAIGCRTTLSMWFHRSLTASMDKDKKEWIADEVWEKWPGLDRWVMKLPSDYLSDSERFETVTLTNVRLFPTAHYHLITRPVFDCLRPGLTLFWEQFENYERLYPQGIRIPLECKNLAREEGPAVYNKHVVATYDPDTSKLVVPFDAMVSHEYSLAH